MSNVVLRPAHRINVDEASAVGRTQRGAEASQQTLIASTRESRDGLR